MAHSLFLDCSNGASGDMIVAALLDAGASEDRLRAVLDSLSVAGEFDVRISRSAKSALDACDFDVILRGVENHDHDMAYLHGHDHDHGHEDPHHDHGHGHDHGHDHPHHHHHAHRGLAEVSAVIDSAAMTDGARALAHRTFDILAAAEAKAHGVPVDEVHFHEVGAVDSIVDVISAAVLLDSLHITRAYVPVLADGHGTIRCQHGIIPVPVPATLNICVAYNLPLSQVPVEGELVTPTGAALVAALDPTFTLPERYRVRRVGLGAGKRTYNRPSILRALLIEEELASGHTPAFALATPLVVRDATQFGAPDDPANRYIYKLECDVDDCPGEELAYAADCLRAAGAREVHWLPLYTKKGRPAYQLQVICAEEDIDRLQLIVFRETTTIGIRRQRMERTVLPREFLQVKTVFGPVTVKRVTLPDGSARISPEYDECAAIAQRERLSLQQVAAEVRRAAAELSA